MTEVCVWTGTKIHLGEEQKGAEGCCYHPHFNSHIDKMLNFPYFIIQYTTHYIYIWILYIHIYSSNMLKLHTKVPIVLLVVIIFLAII